MTELSLALLTFFTSTIAGMIGIGGGMILIAILPSFIPMNALIPVHGITQMSSNISRAVFGYKDIQYSIIPKFLFGSLCGIALFSSVLYFISLEYIPLFIGIYILLSLWSNKFNDRIKKYESYFLLGFFQTGLSIIVGATGPLTITLLFKDFDDKNKVVATSAILMSITHTLKIFVFMFFGFVFFDYISILTAMIIGSFIGSYTGTQLRNKFDSNKFMMLLKIALSLFAIQIIIKVFI